METAQNLVMEVWVTQANLLVVEVNLGYAEQLQLKYGAA